jgi:hypothetical protein
MKAGLAVAVFAGVLGVASADATLVRALPLLEPVAGALDSILEQRAWLFVAGLALGLWLRHEQARPRPPLPFPLVEMRKGVSSAQRDPEPSRE